MRKTYATRAKRAKTTDNLVYLQEVKVDKKRDVKEFEKTQKGGKKEGKKQLKKKKVEVKEADEVPEKIEKEEEITTKMKNLKIKQE